MRESEKERERKKIKDGLRKYEERINNCNGVRHIT